MLPDFPQLKTRLEERRMRAFRKDMDDQMPVVSKIKSVCSHEGDGFSFERTDGIVEQKKFTSVQKQIAVSTHLDFGDAAQSVQDQMRAVATDLASHFERSLFEALDTVTKEVGNQIDAKGRPFTVELYLDSLEMVDIDFDYFGNPELPLFVHHPAVTEGVQAELKRFATSSSLRARAESILVKKREEWRDRESRRRLVD
jgi:hypothetical protein